MARRKRKKTSTIYLLGAIVTLALWFAQQRLSSHEIQQPTSENPKPTSSVSREELPKTPSRPRVTSSSSQQDFDHAKRELRKLFGKGEDFYCSCHYDFDQKPQVNPQACGLNLKGDRARRIEWEHVVPASAFGRKFAEWKKGDAQCGNGKKKKGRECARIASAEFRQMEGDMYNLVPAVGELNRLRGDKVYAEIPGEMREFGKCDFETLGQKTEPRDEIRGDIARIYFYMDARYPGFEIINTDNKSMMERWHLADPMDEAERRRIAKIAAIQGNSFYIGRLENLAQAEKAASPL